MLNKITIKNINSIGECVIDFKKNKYTFLNEYIIDNNVNPIALYGHNGSGKSSMLKAMNQLIMLMCAPITLLKPFTINQFEYYKYNDDFNNKDHICASILLEFNDNALNYKYFISTSINKCIEEEYLECNDKVIFKYKHSIVRKFTYNDKHYDIENNTSKLIPVLRLLASKEINDNYIQYSYNFISNFTFINLPYQNSNVGFVTSLQFQNVNAFDLMCDKSDEVKDILKSFDEFPLYNIKKVENQNSLNSQTEYLLYLDGMKDSALPLSYISEGMRSTSLLLSILTSAKPNTCLFIDELDLSLHPTAIKAFIKEATTRKIQLVFSIHNTNILQELRPDQVYLVKWFKGYSKYKKISDIYPNIRQINNIEKMYLANTFDFGEDDES